MTAPETKRDEGREALVELIRKPLARMWNGIYGDEAKAAIEALSKLAAAPTPQSQDAPSEPIKITCPQCSAGLYAKSTADGWMTIISTPPPSEPRRYQDGEPCDHPGCLSHVTHPCEGCGRIAGHYGVPSEPSGEELFGGYDYSEIKDAIDWLYEQINTPEEYEAINKVHRYLTETELALRSRAPQSEPGQDARGPRDCFNCGHYSEQVSGCDPSMPKCEGHKYWIPRGASLKVIHKYIEGCPRKSITDKHARKRALDALAEAEARLSRSANAALREALRNLISLCEQLDIHSPWLDDARAALAVSPDQKEESK
jgi:hypothetical protein